MDVILLDTLENTLKERKIWKSDFVGARIDAQGRYSVPGAESDVGICFRSEQPGLHVARANV